MPKLFKDNLLKLHHKLRSEIKKKYNRTLSFGDEITDRWEKAEFLKFGKESSIYDSSIVIGDVEVGEHTWIGPFTLLDGSGFLKIGSWCSISTGVQIVTHDSVKWALTRGKALYERLPVEIGDCCHIGSGSIVLKGVTIGNHSVIGACSLVNKNIPPYSVAVGIPAKIIGRVVIKGDKVEFKYFKKNRKK